ncbi:MAG: TonB-dependent receptor [Acinetobacter populi]|jgi:outer membrane receptor protein involved in Fe transport|uniref:TonB-dependent receptor n=1 Tax=Acinetobacter populi TaxID=1582270 RepID=UPI002355CBAD|nr:TonB-dependent receptor [Acinetobacter populi]MCH4248391.1 TonB-dependent receptor [Acinetobacter populi]
MYDQKQCLNLKKKSPLDLAIHTIMLGITLGSSAVSYAAESDNENVAQLPVIKVQAEAEPVKEAFVGNMDLVRSEDDVQPYLIIDRKKIENSGATTVEELLQKLTPMSTSTPTLDPSGFTGINSGIDLRGLGTTQTLVLVNGRRGAGIGSRGQGETTQQQNINGIPLAAIERIEVLPTSASAIYGASALGGVINVVLRRDYVGTEVNVRYGNTFDTDVAQKSVNFVTGFALESGRTQVMITGQKTEDNELKAQDRNFMQKYRQRDMQVYPDHYTLGEQTTIGGGRGRPGTPALVPPAGATPNFVSADGTIKGYIPKGWTLADGLDKLVYGEYNLDPATGVSPYSGSPSIYSPKESDYISLSINRDFTKNLNVFLEASYDYSRRETGLGTYRIGSIQIDLPANSPNNPFDKAIILSYPTPYQNMVIDYSWQENTNKKVATGFTFKAFDDWIFNGDVSYSKANMQYMIGREGNPPVVESATTLQEKIRSGEYIVFTDTSTYGTGYWTGDYYRAGTSYTDQEVWDYSLRSSGTIANWYAGKINLASGLEYRDWESAGIPEHSVNPAVITNKASTTSFYSELSIPFISPQMNLPWAKLLDVQIAGRYEKFDIKKNGASFDATTPTAGFRFAPNNSIMLRASYGEGFVSPTTAQLNPSTSGDPSEQTINGKAYQDVVVVSGGNPNLKPETSKTFNAGIVLTPTVVPNLRFSVDYYKIKKDDNIISSPSNDLLATYFPDNIKYDAAGNVTEIYGAAINGASLKTDGIDTNLSYFIDTVAGNLTLNANHTWVHSYKQQATPATDFVEYINLPTDGPVKNRANFSAYLQATDEWGFGWNTQFYGGYRLAGAADSENILLQGSNKVSSQHYHDIFARYKLPSNIGARYGNPELTVGVNNIFKSYEKDLSSGVKYISRYSDPRLTNYFLNLKFSF